MLNVRYQVNIMGDFNEIDATTKTTIRLLNLFRDFEHLELLPGQFQELSPEFPTPINRLNFMSPDRQWVLLLGAKRIQLDRNFVATVSNLGSIDDFIQQSSNLLGAIMENYDLLATRISLVTSSFFDTMSQDKLKSVYSRLTNAVEYYVDNPPTEWNIRSTSRSNCVLNGTEEKVNVITNIGRMQGQLLENSSWSDIDRINLDFDINTVPENSKPRLSKPMLATFLASAIQTRNNLISQVEGFMNE